VLIQDHIGVFVAAQSWVRSGWLDPMGIEAMAAGLAVKTCKALGHKRVLFEGDAKVVVNAANCEGENLSKFGQVVADIQSEVKSLISWKMFFINRECNNAAHTLAKYAIKHVLDKVWVVPSDFIRDLLLVEQSALSG
jgi:ribonuclease HI